MIFASSKDALRRRLEGALLKVNVYMTALMISKPFVILFRLQSPTSSSDLCLLHTTQVFTPRSKPPTSLRSPRMSVSAYLIFILLTNAQAPCSPLGHSCSLRQGHPKVKRLPPFSYLCLSLVLFIIATRG